jgi:hypothetical protein
VGPFGLGYGTFYNYMIDLSVVVYTLSFGIKISVWTTDDCEDCAMGGECIGLLWILLNLRWRWVWRVGFGLDLRVGVVWRWVCNFWHCRRICDLWSWRRLRMVNCGVVIWLLMGRSLDLAILVGLRWKKGGLWWRVVLVGSPLHSVVNFSGCWLLQRLWRVLLHFSFGL